MAEPCIQSHSCYMLRPTSMLLSFASPVPLSCTVLLKDLEKELAIGVSSNLCSYYLSRVALCSAKVCCFSLQLQEKFQSTELAQAWRKPGDILRKPRAKGLEQMQEGGTR